MEEKLKVKRREELKLAKRRHKRALKNTKSYGESREDTIRQIMGSRTPKWGSIKVSLLKFK